MAFNKKYVLSKEFNTVELLKSGDQGITEIVKTKGGKLLIHKRIPYVGLPYSKLKELEIEGIPRVYKVNENLDYEETNIYEEKINGQSLAEYINKGLTFPEDVVKNYALQLCDILIELHEEEILHRDIKPSNIMLDQKGKLWLIDFGSARQFKEEYDTTKLHDTHIMVTHKYAPPEQYGSETTGPDSDIYSFGVTMAELLDPKYKGFLKEIFTQCQAKDRTRRYSTVSLLKQAIINQSKIYYAEEENFKTKIYNMDIGPVEFTVGKKMPLTRNSTGETSIFQFRPSGSTYVMYLKRPHKMIVDAFRYGQIDIALSKIGNVIYMVFKTNVHYGEADVNSHTSRYYDIDEKGFIPSFAIYLVEADTNELLAKRNVISPDGFFGIYKKMLREQYLSDYTDEEYDEALEAIREKESLIDLYQHPQAFLRLPEKAPNSRDENINTNFTFKNGESFPYSKYVWKDNVVFNYGKYGPMIVANLSDVTAHEIEQIRYGKLEIAMLPFAEGIVKFVLKYGNGKNVIEVGYNIYMDSPDDVIDIGKAEYFRVVFTDPDTTIIKAIRYIKMDDKFAEVLYAVLEQQYDNPVEADRIKEVQKNINDKWDVEELFLMAEYKLIEEETR